jgi:hypothetical protein
MSEKLNPESEENSEQQSLTPEEIKQRRATLIKFYKDQNEILALQTVYEKHRADIMENIAKEALWRARYAEMMHGPKASSPDPDLTDTGDKKRKLKED